MSKKDQPGRRFGNRFAWRAALPGASTDWIEAAVGDPAGYDSGEPITPEQIAYVERQRAAFTALIEQVRTMPEGPDKIDAACSLVLQGAVTDPLTAIGVAPQAAVRFARLVVRYYRHLSHSVARDAAIMVSWLVVGTHPEVADLLCEAAEVGDSYLCECAQGAVIGSGEPVDGRRVWPGLGARLAAIVDKHESINARCFAAHWVAFGQWPAAFPALRRALRQPVIRLRVYALHVLRLIRPTPLDPSDLLYLLEDAVVHPLPFVPAGEDSSDAREDQRRYEDQLVLATGGLNPKGGTVPLLSIMKGDCVVLGGARETLGYGWALETLAAGYPNSARWLVEGALQYASPSRRYAGARAAARLSEEWARPMLLFAARDPSPIVSRFARDAWIRLYAEPCPVEASAGAFTELLLAPLSEEALSRLLLLRTAKDEVRARMLALVLAESGKPDAPAAIERERLVVLLFGVCDLPIGTIAGVELPESTHEWATVLVDRFGDAGVRGLVHLAGNFPFGFAGWLDPLAGLLQDNAVAQEHYPRVSDLAAAALFSPAWQNEYEALIILRLAGVPAGYVENLWDLATSGEAERFEVRSLAARALSACPNKVRLEALALPAMEAALANGDLVALERVSQVGIEARCERVVARLVESLNALLDVATLCKAGGPSDRSGFSRIWVAFRRVRSLVVQLHQSKQLPEAWIEQGLADSTQLRFIVAAWVASKKMIAAHRDTITGALTSNCHDGACAEASMIALLRADIVSMGDRRVERTLDRACPAARLSLVRWLLGAGAPADRVRRYLVEAIAGDDLAVAAEAEVTAQLNASGLLAEAYPQVKLAATRRSIEETVGIAGEPELYWRMPEERRQEVGGNDADSREDDEG